MDAETQALMDKAQQLRASPAGDVHIDVDRAKHEFGRDLAGLLTGERDPSAVAKVSRGKGARFANFESLCDAMALLNPEDRPLMEQMKMWKANVLKSQLGTRQEIFKTLLNLTRPEEEKKGVLAGLLKRGD